MKKIFLLFPSGSKWRSCPSGWLAVKRQLATMLLFGAFICALPGQASLSVQGVLTKSDGTAVDDGNYPMIFKLWTDSTGGTAVHTETIQTVETIGGVYSVVLGRNGTPVTAPFDVVYYLGASLVDGPELSPRPLLPHAPYALSLLGQTNQFPSIGTVKADALQVAGAATINALNVTGTATLPNINVTGHISANAFVGASGAPAPLTGGKGFAFGTGGDLDGGLFSTADGTVSIFSNSAERIWVNTTQTTNLIYVLGKVVAASDAAGGGYAFDNGETSGMFGSDGNVYLRSNGANRISLLEDGTYFSSPAIFHDSTYFNGDVSSNQDKITMSKPVQVDATRTFSENPSPNKYFRYFDVGEDNYEESGTVDFSQISIKVSYNVLADGFYAVSDRRIKKDFTRSNTAESLAKLLRLQVTDYRYVDEIAKGRALRKGIIAQEVEAVEPAAIVKSTGFIPNVYAPAAKIREAGRQLVFSMTAPHGLQKGDRVRIFEGSVRNDLTIEAATDTEFTVAMWGRAAPAGAFVFGKEVPDFKEVNYDHLFTLNVAATQELARRIEALGSALATAQAEYRTLQVQNAALEDRKSAFSALLGQLVRSMELLENRAEQPRN